MSLVTAAAGFLLGASTSLARGELWPPTREVVSMFCLFIVFELEALVVVTRASNEDSCSQLLRRLSHLRHYAKRARKHGK